MKSSAKTVKKHINSEKGFTLIELIMAMAIMSILLTMYYSLFFSGGKQYEFVHDSYQKQNEARIAMSYITTKIRQNDLILPGTNTHAVSVQSIGSPPNERKYLRIESIAEDDTLEYENIYEYYVAGSDTKLMSLVKNEVDFNFESDGSVIADSLYDISFDSREEDGSTCIEIIILYDSSDNGRFEETVVLRAK